MGVALGTVAVGVWMLAGQASAHVEASPASVAAGSTDTITFNVEHGCGDSATVKLEMKLAEGVTARIMREELPRRSHEVQRFWLGECNCDGHLN